MTADHLKGIEEFEAGLWKIADNLRANSNLASNEYFMPIMGLLLLRQATNRYYAALEVMDTDRKAGRMAKRPPRGRTVSGYAWARAAKRLGTFG